MGQTCDIPQKKKEKKKEDAGAFQHVAPESSSDLVSVSDGASFPFANENRRHGVIPAPCEPNMSAVCASHPALMLQLLEYLFYSPLPRVVKRTQAFLYDER